MLQKHFQNGEIVELWAGVHTETPIYMGIGKVTRIPDKADGLYDVVLTQDVKFNGFEYQKGQTVWIFGERMRETGK